MDLTSPVTRKVLRLQICSTEVQCQRVPVWSHVQREKVQQFIDGNAFYVLQSASGEGNQVRQAAGAEWQAAGAEWQPRGPWDQCFDNKCLPLFGLRAWCLLCCPYRPLSLHDCAPCQRAVQTGTWTRTHTGPLHHLSCPVEAPKAVATNTVS